MTVAEAERFYKEDLKKYNIKKNKEFLVWLNSMNYAPVINVDEMQELIDYIANWYEIKYSEKELTPGVKYRYVQDNGSLSKEMTIDKLLYRLPNSQLSFMLAGYRASSWVTLDDDNVYAVPRIIKVGEEDVFPINEIPVYVNHLTGNINIQGEIQDYYHGDPDVDIPGLIKYFKENYPDKYNFKLLEDCEYRHECDIKLRNELLQITALKLLYSKNTNPEKGHRRAVNLIDEFNDKFNLNLSTREIDSIMNQNYKNNADTKKKLFK